MMTEQAIRAVVVEIIYEVCRPERPDLSDHNKPLLAGDLDSLDFASVLMALEDKFNITMSEDDIETISNINQLVAYIAAKLIP